MSIEERIVSRIYKNVGDVPVDVIDLADGGILDDDEEKVG
jgi:hypothetical protein